MEKLVEIIFGKDLPTVEEIFDKYKPRQLVDNQKVTRYAPSPTGFMHIGNLYTALIGERMAHNSGGIFYLRIEDTDQKREVEGAIKVIIDGLDYFGIKYDEGKDENNNDVGLYGPYKQSERKEIYKVFVRELLIKGQAYPCFYTEEELEIMVNQQKAQNCSRLGCYGVWAKYRNLPIEEAIRKIENNEEFVMRFKSGGNFNTKVVVNDLIRGNLEFPENDLDIVIMKKNGGLPTYHFAHLVDDFLMGTTTVIRGADEWLPSLPLHVQLFQTMKWKTPKYAHISSLLKVEENGNKRKLSKRKDPEANIEYFKELGYPKDSVIEYLLNLANSNFEDCRKQNPEKDYKEFPFDIKKVNTSGALFDLAKLNSVSREVISKMTANEIYSETLVWSKKYDNELFELITKNKEYVINIFNIERENTKKPRKDIAKWNEVKNEIIYFFELDNNLVKQSLGDFSNEDIKKIIEKFLESYDINDDKEKWFSKLKIVAVNCGYSDSIKEYKENPNNFKGSIVDVAKLIRVAITGREQSPDLCLIMKILGVDKIIERLELCSKNY
jgi:glutamyl-tRNA synthetase